MLPLCIMLDCLVLDIQMQCGDTRSTSLRALQQQMLASKNTPGVPSRYEWVQEAYEQLTLCKYNGHPHVSSTGLLR